MKKFLALFMAPVEAFDAMREAMKGVSPEEQKKEMEKWRVWIEHHSAHIVDSGGGVGSAQRVRDDGSISDTRNEIGGYMIIQAESAEEAAAMFKDSPGFGMEGGRVEVMEIMGM